ncbi:MAG: universal stress protein [Myxococcota bacterium]|nr:universal stress protein [Myxococcota bacterium]
MQRFRHIMVALTLTERDSHLLRYAAMVARLCADEVRFVHVLGKTDERGRKEALARCQELVDEHFTTPSDSVTTCCEVLKGPLIDRLLVCAAEQEVDLLMVGHTPDHRPGGGSLVRRMAMKAPCSVWIVPDDSPLVLKKILVPVDFSGPSADAMVVALSLARLVGEVEVLPLHAYSSKAVLAYEEDEPIVRGEEERHYRDFAKELDFSRVKTQPLLVEGGADVARTIHRVASEQAVDLKVMATRGRSRSAAILLGSVAEGVITEARTPVLTVKHFGAQQGLLRALLERTRRSDGEPHF